MVFWLLLLMGDCQTFKSNFSPPSSSCLDLGLGLDQAAVVLVLVVLFLAAKGEKGLDEHFGAILMTTNHWHRQGGLSLLFNNLDLDLDSVKNKSKFEVTHTQRP